MSDNKKSLQRILVRCWFFVAILMFSISPSVLALEEGKGCIKRQAENNFKGTVTHGPVSEGKCMKCHAPHASGNSKGLKSDLPALCLDCHDESMKDDQNRRLPSLKAAFEDSTMKLHQPFADGDCSCCHDPHTSSHYRLLNNEHNKSLYTKYSKGKYMCFGCHSEKAFSEPRTLTETNFRNGNLNLHYRHVNRQKGRSCQTCHHHHASKNAALIREKLPFGQGEITITEFKKTKNGGKCAASCHRVAQYDRLEPFPGSFRVSKREGEDATDEELERALKKATEKQAEKSAEKSEMQPVKQE